MESNSGDPLGSAGAPRTAAGWEGSLELGGFEGAAAVATPEEVCGHPQSRCLWRDGRRGPVGHTSHQASRSPSRLTARASGRRRSTTCCNSANDSPECCGPRRHGWGVKPQAKDSGGLGIEDDSEADGVPIDVEPEPGIQASDAAGMVGDVPCAPRRTFRCPGWRSQSKAHVSRTQAPGADGVGRIPWANPCNIRLLLPSDATEHPPGKPRRAVGQVAIG